MAFELPPLPYDYAALEPHIDEQTMRIHHGKHHQTYVDKANEALAGTQWEDAPVEEVLSSIDPEQQKPLRNNAGGHANHSLFWTIMSPNGGGEPEGDLLAAIQDAFGDAASLRQNDRFVVVLKVTETDAKYARLLLVDQLPAGWEIDNPNLVDGGSLSGLSWLKRDVEPTATEYRDDRFVAAIDRSSGQPAFFTLAYIARAVDPGRYVHPPATVEDIPIS